jgi:hypothetical protein
VRDGAARRNLSFGADGAIIRVGTPVFYEGRLHRFNCLEAPLEDEGVWWARVTQIGSNMDRELNVETSTLTDARGVLRRIMRALRERAHQRRVLELEWHPICDMCVASIHGRGLLTDQVYDPREDTFFPLPLELIAAAPPCSCRCCDGPSPADWGSLPPLGEVGTIERDNCRCTLCGPIRGPWEVRGSQRFARRCRCVRPKAC